MIRLIIDTSKTFVIQHPSYTEKYLVHACLEGPEAGVYYRGENVVQDGKCLISLPDYTSSFEDFTLYLTSICDEEHLSPRVLGYSKTSTHTFCVYGEDEPFSWFAHGKRLSIDVEPDKGVVSVKGEGPYKYIG